MERVALWSVREGAPRRLAHSGPATEADLERWVELAPEVIRDDLIVVARQLIFPSRERLDLLCIEGGSRWVVIELKRGRLAREVVAQALDYLSLLADLDSHALRQRLEEQGHLAKLAPEQLKTVQELLESESTDSPRETAAILVGLAAEPSLLRIVEHLATRHAVPVSVIELQAFSTPSGDVILAREETGSDAAVGTSATPSASLDERWTRVRSEAEQMGYGDALRGLERELADSEVFLRPYTRSVMLTPPTAKNRYVGAVTFVGTSARLAYGVPELLDFYPGLRGTPIEDVLGTPSPRLVSPDELIEFAAALRSLLAHRGNGEEPAEGGSVAE